MARAPAVSQKPSSSLRPFSFLQFPVAKHPSSDRAAQIQSSASVPVAKLPTSTYKTILHGSQAQAALALLVPPPRRQFHPAHALSHSPIVHVPRHQ